MAWDQNLFNQALDKGHSAAWDQNWDEAIKYYRQALLEFPDNSIALTSLGLALTEKQDYVSALQCYLHAAQVNPDDPIAAASLGRMYERLGRLDEAVSAFMQAAELYIKGHLNEKAIENFIAAVRLQPDNLNARVRLSSVYDGLGMKAEAVAEYLSAASLMQKNGDKQKALQIVNHALTLQPDNLEAREALGILQKGDALPPPLRMRGGTGAIHMAKVNQMTQGEETEVSEMDPIAEAEHLALVKLAGLLFEKEEEQAISGQVNRRSMSSLTKGTGGLSTDHSAKSRMNLHLSKAIDAQTQGDANQAAIELERAVEIGATQAEASFDLGLLLAHTDGQKALKYLLQSVRHPNFALGSYLLMAGIYEAAAEFNAAAVDLLRALALADGETVPAEKADELTQLYDPIIDSQERETDQSRLKALCTSIQGQLLRKDWRAHVKTVRQQLGDTQETGDPMPMAGMLLETKGSKVVDALSEIRKLEQDGHYRSAMEVAYDVIPLSPSYLPLHVKMGDLLVKEGHLSVAVEKFILAADLYNLRGETTQAITLLKKVASMASMDLSVRSKLIELLTSQNRSDEVLEQYNELARVYYQLAELDMARQTFLAGSKLAQDVQNGRPWVIKFLNRIADIDVQRLDWRNAIRMYEQLRSMQPEEPTARVKLIELNIRLGQANVALNEADGYIGFLRNTGQKELSLSFMREMTKEHPEIMEFHQKYADFLIKDEKIPEAVKELDLIAKTQVNAGNKAAGIKTLKAIVELKPKNISEYQNAIDKLSA